MLLVGLDQLNLLVGAIVCSYVVSFALILQRYLLLHNTMRIWRLNRIHTKLREVVIVCVLSGIRHYLWWSHTTVLGSKLQPLVRSSLAV
jgi:hypothetical protein